MVRQKGRSYIIPKELRKMEAANAARTEVLQEGLHEEQLNVDEKNANSQAKPLELKLRKGKGGHHCPFLDGASHRTSPECFKLHHMGVCPKCLYPKSAIKGCKKCGVLGADLEYDNIIIPLKLQAIVVVQDGVDKLKDILPWSIGKKK